jgi:hypothetical protein
MFCALICTAFIGSGNPNDVSFLPVKYEPEYDDWSLEVGCNSELQDLGKGT